MTDKKQDMRAELMVTLVVDARSMIELLAAMKKLIIDATYEARIAELEAQIEAVGAGGIGAMLPRHAQPALAVVEPVAIVAVSPGHVSVGWMGGYVPKHNDKLYAAPPPQQIAEPASQPDTDAADMFWNIEDPERPHESIDTFLNDEICQSGVEVGAEFTLLRALSLPKVKIRVTAVDDESCEAEYEVIEANPKEQS